MAVSSLKSPSSLSVLFISFLILLQLVLCREFVNSVSCIKILSPEEVQQMGKQGIQLLSSAPARRISNGCDSYVSRQESRSLSTGMAPVGSVEF